MIADGCLGGIKIGDVKLRDLSSGALSFDHSKRFCRTGFIGPVIDDYEKAAARQFDAYGPADTFACTGYDGQFLLWSIRHKFPRHHVDEQDVMKRSPRGLRRHR
jgi:hypothetical protein